MGKTFCGQVRESLDMDQDECWSLGAFGVSSASLFGILGYYEVFPTIYSTISAYTLSLVFLGGSCWAYETVYDSDSEEQCVPQKPAPKKQPTRYGRWLCGLLIFGLLVWCEQV